MREIFAWRFATCFIGRMLMRRIGSRVMKARIWCAEVYDLDCGKLVDAWRG